MGARTGQFRRTMRERFGPAAAIRAERGVKELKRDRSVRNPFAIITASMAGTTRRDRGRR